MNKLSNGIKSLSLDSGEFLFFWYANNAGRGDSNVTIVRSSSSVRAATSARQQGVIASTKTSGWSGNVNFSARVRAELGL